MVVWVLRRIYCCILLNVIVTNGCIQYTNILNLFRPLLFKFFPISQYDRTNILMRTLAEFNGICNPNINLTQVCWDLNELITMEDLLQGNKTINQLDHNAYTWRRAKEV
jgi:hypothetical protein